MWTIPVFSMRKDYVSICLGCLAIHVVINITLLQFRVNELSAMLLKLRETAKAEKKEIVRVYMYI